MPPTLLIVDDEPAIRDALRRALRDEPYRVLEAGSAEEALGLVAREPVDLLLSDHNMPGGTGLSLCEALQLSHPAVTRLLMTGAGDLREAEEAQERDAVYHVLPKPWDSKELRLALRLGLRHRAEQQELARLQELLRAQRRIIADLEGARRPSP